MFDILTIFMRALILVGIPAGIAGIAGEIRYILEVWKRENMDL